MGTKFVDAQSPQSVTKIGILSHQILFNHNLTFADPSVPQSSPVRYSRKNQKVLSVGHRSIQRLNLANLVGARLRCFPNVLDYIFQCRLAEATVVFTEVEAKLEVCSLGHRSYKYNCGQLWTRLGEFIKHQISPSGTYYSLRNVEKM